MDNTLVSRIEQYLENNKDMIINDLCRLVKIPSVKGEPDGKSPYGIICRRALEVSSAILKEQGFESRLDKSNRYAVCEIGEGERSIGIFAHSDVVPTGDGWTLGMPFEPTLQNGYVIGRGASDNKSGVIMSAYVPKMLSELGVKLKSRLVVFIGSDEESGMDDIAHFVSENPMPTMSFVPDGAFPVGIGEKGICRFFASFDKPFESIIELEGGNAYNIVLDKVNCRISFSEELYEQLKAKQAENSAIELDCENGEIKLTCHGIASHAAMPQGSVNATNLLARTLVDCSSLCENDRTLLSKIALITEGYSGAGFGIEHTDSYFGNLTCVNGMCRTADAKPQISFDIRYGVSLPDKELERRLFEKSRELGFAITEYNNKQGFAIDRNDEIVKAITKVYADISGDQNAKPFYMMGGTYARYLEKAFSVGTSAGYKKTPIDIPKGHGEAHQADEILCVDAFLEAMKIFALMLIESDRLLNE